MLTFDSLRSVLKTPSNQSTNTALVPVNHPLSHHFLRSPSMDFKVFAPSSLSTKTASGSLSKTAASGTISKHFVLCTLVGSLLVSLFIQHFVWCTLVGSLLVSQLIQHFVRYTFVGLLFVSQLNCFLYRF